MSDLNSDLRLAVDTGKIDMGHRDVLRAINQHRAKAIVIAEKGMKDMADDIVHMSGIAELKIIRFKGNSMELGGVCGKPYSVNSLAIIEPGNSNILNEEY